MAGFLDSKERVIDMVLTDIGKSLLLKGELQFVYWIPYDDEVDYNPPVTYMLEGNNYVSASDMDTGELEIRTAQLIESPLIREATMGYRGLNLREEDTTNVHRPMYSAPPGVGQSYPLPILKVEGLSSLGAVEISMQQIPLMRGATSRGFERSESSLTRISSSYAGQGYPPYTRTEGFLITMYQSKTLGIDQLGQVSGGFKEILHNNDINTDIVYSNDLKLVVT